MFVSGQAGVSARLRAYILAGDAFKDTAGPQQHVTEWPPAETGVACCTDPMGGIQLPCSLKGTGRKYLNKEKIDKYKNVTLLRSLLAC